MMIFRTNCGKNEKRGNRLRPVCRFCRRHRRAERGLYSNFKDHLL